MKHLLLTLSTALLGLTAAQAAEPVTPTGGLRIEFSSAENSRLDGNSTFVINDAEGNAAVKITGDFYDTNHNYIAPNSPNETGNSPCTYTIASANEDYRVAYFKLVIEGENANVNLFVQYNGNEGQSTSAGPVTIEGFASENDPMTFQATGEGRYNKGRFASSVIILEPVIPEIENGVRIDFTHTDGTYNNSNRTLFTVSNDEAEAVITNSGNGFYAAFGGFALTPTTAGATYTIAAADPDLYKVAFFRFEIEQKDGTTFNVTYNGKEYTTSPTDTRNIVIEGYTSKNDPMTFQASIAAGGADKAIIKSGIIILVPTEVEKGEQTVTFDNTNANTEGEYTLTGDKINGGTYITKNVPRIKISTTDGDLYMYNTSKLCLSPGSTAGSDDNVNSSAWKEFTMAPYRPEVYRLVSCNVQIQGYNNTDHIKIYYNGEIKSTADGIVTISYPVNGPATQADEVQAEADPVVTFKATTTVDREAKKGEIKSATFVLEAKDNVTTGMETITGVMNSEGEVIWYDLNGRRVENPTNGIFVNSKGKKHIFAN